MQKTQIRSLGWEDPLEKEMKIHSRILAQRIPDFLEDMASLSHSIVFFYFFALITGEGFFISYLT